MTRFPATSSKLSREVRKKSLPALKYTVISEPALSKDRSREAVIVIAHGPEDNADNGPDLAEVKKLAAYVQKKGRFARPSILAANNDKARRDTREDRS